MQLVRMTIIFLMPALLLTGCQTYQPRPLNIADLNRVLVMPNKTQLARQATLLNHPRISPVSIDFSQPLTPKELAVLAVLTDPDLKALRAKEGVADAQVFDAGLLPDPKFSFNYAETVDSMPGLINPYSNDLLWDIASLITTRTNIKIAKAQALQTHYDIAWQEWLVANQAELLASRIYYLQQQLNITKNATQTAKNLLNITQSNLLKHDATIDDFGLRQATYLDFLDQAITTERTLQKTILQLNQLLGFPPGVKIAIKFMPLRSFPLDANNLYNQAQVYRLDLLALQAGYASQEAKLYQAILGQFPHFTIDLTQSTDNTNAHAVGGIINFDIPIINRNQGAIAIAKATRGQLYLEYIARLNQTRSDIATLVVDIKIINKEEQILNQQIPQMEKTESLMREGVSTGNITLITYESVLTSLLTNQLRLLTLKQTITEQMIALQMATGRYQ